jgi:hypothetical protein
VDDADDAAVDYDSGAEDVFAAIAYGLHFVADFEA